MSFQIVTDSCCDLSAAQVKELELTVAPLSVELDGKSIPEGIIALGNSNYCNGFV